MEKGEDLVKKAIKVPLFQHEFDALAFNVGSLTKIAPKLCRKINSRQYSAGTNEMLDITKSNGEEMKRSKSVAVLNFSESSANQQVIYPLQKIKILLQLKVNLK